MREPRTRPNATVNCLLFPVQVNLVNLADTRRIDTSDRIIEVYAGEIKAGAMILVKVKDEALVIDVYDSMGPVKVNVGGVQP